MRLFLCIAFALLDFAFNIRLKRLAASGNQTLAHIADRPFLSVDPFDDLAKPFVLLDGPPSNPSKAILVGTSHYVDALRLDWFPHLVRYLSASGHFSPDTPKLMFFELEDVGSWKEKLEQLARAGPVPQSVVARFQALNRALDSRLFHVLKELYADSITPIELDAQRRASFEKDASCESKEASMDNATIDELITVADWAYKTTDSFGWLPAFRHVREIMKEDHEEIYNYQLGSREEGKLGWRAVLKEQGAFHQHSVIVAGMGHFSEILRWFKEEGFTITDPMLELIKELPVEKQQLAVLSFQRQRYRAQQAINAVIEKRPLLKEERERQEQRRQLQEQHRKRREEQRQRKLEELQKQEPASDSKAAARKMAQAPEVVKRSDCLFRFWRW